MNQLLSDAGTPSHVILHERAAEGGDLRIVANRPTFQAADSIAVGVGPLDFETDGLGHFRSESGWTVFEGHSQRASLWVVNRSETPRRVRLRLIGPGASRTTDRVIEPGASLEIRATAPLPTPG